MDTSQHAEKDPSQYADTQQISTDQMEQLAFDTAGARMVARGDTAHLTVDGIDYEAPLAEVTS